MPNSDDLARSANRAAAIYCQFLNDLATREVAPACDRESLRAAFAGTVDEEGIGFAAVLDEFEGVVLPNSMTTPHPRYAGLVNSSPLEYEMMGRIGPKITFCIRDVLPSTSHMSVGSM